MTESDVDVVFPIESVLLTVHSICLADTGMQTLMRSTKTGRTG